MEEKTRQERCRFCHRFMGKNHNEAHCVFDGWEDDKVKVVIAEDCDSCDHFFSRFIGYPLIIQGIENSPIAIKGRSASCGELCEVTLAEKETGEKSFLGIYLGDLPTQILTSFNPEIGILKNSAMTNPAIYVFELNRIVYGYESWWRTIKSVDDFKGITDKNIENTWYVRLLRDMQKES